MLVINTRNMLPMMGTLRVVLPYQVFAVVVSWFAKHRVDMVDGTAVATGWIVVVEFNDDGGAVDAIVVRFVLLRAGPGEVNLF